MTSATASSKIIKNNSVTIIHEDDDGYDNDENDGHDIVKYCFNLPVDQRERQNTLQCTTNYLFGYSHCLHSIYRQKRRNVILIHFEKCKEKKLIA